MESILGGGQGLLWEGSKGAHPLWVPRTLTGLQASYIMGLTPLGLGSRVSHEGGQHRVKDGRAETLGPMGHMEGDQAQRLLRSWRSP